MCFLAQSPLGLDLDGTTGDAEMLAFSAGSPYQLLHLSSIAFSADITVEEAGMLCDALSDRVVSKEELYEMKRYAALNHSPTSDRMIRIAALLSSGIDCIRPDDLYIPKPSDPRYINRRSIE